MPRKNRVDYTEIEVSSGESESTIFASESGIASLKLEDEDRPPVLEGDRDTDLWTPGTLTDRANQVTEQVSRLATANSELAMARETERVGLEKIMEMMV